MLKKTEVIWFILLACGIYYLSYIQLDSTFFLYGLLKLFLYFLFCIAFIYAVYRVFKDQRKLTLLKKTSSLIIGAIFISSFFLQDYLIKTDGGKTVVLSAGHNGDINFIHLDLRNDKTFKLINSGPFGGSIYRGAYRLKNDTLQIDNDIKGLYPSKSFVVRQNEEGQKYFDPIGNDTASYNYALYFNKNHRKTYSQQ